MTRTPYLLGLALCIVAAVAHASPDRVVVPGNGPTYDPQLKVLAEIRDEVKGLRDEVRALRAGAPIKAGADRKAAREQVMLRACAGCHTPARVEDGKDGGLILFADDESRGLKPLSAREQADAADQIKRGDMPKKPRPPLSAKERELFE